MKVRFKKLSPLAKTPVKKHADDAGFDLYAASVAEDRKHDVVSYGTGIAVEIPEGYMGFIFPRSSIYKEDIMLANSVGLIDSGYRSEILVKFKKLQPHTHRYTINDRIAQLVIVPYPEIELEESNELSSTDRGDGGFGSTGR